MLKDYFLKRKILFKHSHAGWSTLFTSESELNPFNLWWLWGFFSVAASIVPGSKHLGALLPTSTSTPRPSCQVSRPLLSLVPSLWVGETLFSCSLVQKWKFSCWPPALLWDVLDRKWPNWLFSQRLMQELTFSTSLLQFCFTFCVWILQKWTFQYVFMWFWIFLHSVFLMYSIPYMHVPYCFTVNHLLRNIIRCMFNV